VPYTLGFRTQYELTLHFVKHGVRLGVATEAEYLMKADLFLGGPLTSGTTPCVRVSDGDRLRFNERAQLFGVLIADNHIRTFYKFTPPPRDFRWFSSQCTRG
jgi:pyocin large subunit-like protein